MPFIDCRITTKLTEEKKEQLKAELGRAIPLLHKSETYLMVGISDGYDLWMGGAKISGAYVGVSLFGRESRPDCEKMTAAICDILSRVADVPGEGVYVTYRGVENWGWNGGLF